MSKKPQAVVLAAGKGTRMNSELPKVCHRCFGEPIIVHVLRGLRRSGVANSTVVVGEGKGQVKDLLPEGTPTVEQPRQLGTGDALRVALENRDFSPETPLVVVLGDIPGIRPPTFERLADRFVEEDAELVLLSTHKQDPTGYGRIVREDSGTVRRIVEEEEATSRERSINLVNTGVMCAAAGTFQRLLPELEPNNEAGEYYLTDVVGKLTQEAKRVVHEQVEDDWEVTGINTRRQLVDFERRGYRRVIDRLFEQGVTVHDPNRVQVGPWVEVGEDVVLEGNVKIVGVSRIGSGTRVSGDCFVVDSVLGEQNRVERSRIEGARLGKEVRVGPYCHVRPGTEVGDRVRLGNYVEIKNSTVGSDTNVAHLSYVGDAELGERVNVGAGTITCNYDGRQKHRTVVEDEVFIGSNSQLVAPVHVAEGAMIGAGTTVTQDVPPFSLALSRVDQENRENWVREVWKKRHSQR